MAGFVQVEHRKARIGIGDGDAFIAQPGLATGDPAQTRFKLGLIAVIDLVFRGRIGQIILNRQRAKLAFTAKVDGGRRPQIALGIPGTLQTELLRIPNARPATQRVIAAAIA